MDVLHLSPKSSLLLVTLALLLCAAAPALAEAFQIDVTARPPRVVYTEGARVTLDVTVADAAGRTAPDGTAVYFHTTLGSLPATAYTRRGQVLVLLENSTGPGTAIVTITVGESRQTLNIDFLGSAAAGGGGAVERPAYRLKARNVYYGVDTRTFDLRDGAEFVTPAFTVTAGALQFGINSNQLTAQGNVTISAGTKVLTGEKLRLDVAQRRGVLIQVEPEICKLQFTLPELTPSACEVEDPNSFLPLDPLPTRTWILCASATIIPNEQIQFRRPEFYLNNFDRRLYALPYHVLDLRSSTSGMVFNSKITLTSDAGLNVDFPVYYAATTDHIGSLHIRQVTKGSEFYRGKSGIQLGIEEEYLVGRNGDGALYLDDLTRPTRSAAWTHTHDFGNTTVNLNTAYERYDEATPYTTRVGMNVTQQLGRRTSLRLTSNWSRFKGGEDTFGELSASLPSWEMGRTGVSVSVSPYVGVRQSVNPATADVPEQSDSNFYQGISTGVGLPTLRVLGGTVGTSLNHEISHDRDGTISNYFDASTAYRRQIGRYFSSSLSYSYSLSGTNRDEVAAEPSQRVSLDFSGSRNQSWAFFAYSALDLDSEVLYSSGSLTYYLPWQRSSAGEPRWFFRATASTSSGNGASTTDQLFSLGRDIGPYSLVLHYSPTGNTATTGIGSGTGKKWALELVRQAW